MQQRLKVWAALISFMAAITIELIYVALNIILGMENVSVAGT